MPKHHHRGARYIYPDSTPESIELRTRVNWHEDPWFAKTHADNLTDDFKETWLREYGTPEDYGDHATDPSVYWTRCAFAWAGYQWGVEEGRSLESESHLEDE